MAIGNKQKIIFGLRITALAIFVGIIVFLSVRYTPQITDLFQRRQELKQYIEAMGLTGIAVFILLQVFQVVVAAVPGEVVQVAGGYFFGTFWGTIYLVTGVVIGSIIDFYAARLLGFKIVKMLMPAKRMEKMYNLMSGAKSDLIMFLLFLIPGLPKDILTYLAGLTPVRPGRFLFIAVTARLPALIVSSYIGASFQQENNIAAITASAMAVLLFAAGVLLKDKIVAAIRK